MSSSKQNLAGQNKESLRALAEFANMGDNPPDWRVFRRRCPALLPAEIYTDSEEEIRLNLKRAATPVPSEEAPQAFVLTDSGLAHRQFRPAGAGRWVDYKEP